MLVKLSNVIGAVVALYLLPIVAVPVLFPHGATLAGILAYGVATLLCAALTKTLFLLVVALLSHGLEAVRWRSPGHGMGLRAWVGAQWNRHAEPGHYECGFRALGLEVSLSGPLDRAPS